MRQTQPMGYSSGGNKFFADFEVLVKEVGHKIYPDGTKEPFEREEYVSTLKFGSSGKTSGMFDEVELLKYTTWGGVVFYEYVQECIWSGGPMEFYALKDIMGIPVKSTLWTKEELENELGYSLDEEVEPE